jgi:predicted porin
MTSSKKLIAALAVSLPLVAAAQTAPAAAPAAPAKPLVNIYGTLNVNFHSEEAPSASRSAQNVDYRFGISTDSSNIGVRGTADVAYGLGVVYQCETSANVDGIGASGICNRNSRLGLSSPYGTLFYGNWDSPYKAAWYGTKADDAFGNTDVFDAAAIMGSPGFNTKSSAGVTAAATGISPVFPTSGAGAAQGIAASTTTTFAVRAADSVAYHSPKVGGLSFKAQYSANRFGDINMIRAPELYSAVLNYDMGPISVFGAVEDHEDWNTSKSRDIGWKAGAGYELATAFGTTTIGGVYEMLNYRSFGGTTLIAASAGFPAIKEYKRQAVMGNLKHRIGDHEFRGRIGWADEGDATDLAGNESNATGFGAMNYALGYAHYLSKAAQVYAFWTKIENEQNATYTFATAGFAAVAAATPPGADPWSVGLGMRYAF